MTIKPEELRAGLEADFRAYEEATEKANRSLARAMEALDQWLAMEHKMPAAVNPDWQMPTRKCSKCGADLVPVAVDTGDGWYLGWDDCEHLCDAPADLYAFIEWPFVKDWANVEDLERLGFRIE